jgi:hypothetical protein
VSWDAGPTRPGGVAGIVGGQEAGVAAAASWLARQDPTTQVVLDVGEQTRPLRREGKGLVGVAMAALGEASPFCPPGDAMLPPVGVGRGLVQAKEFPEARFQLEGHEVRVLCGIEDPGLAFDNKGPPGAGTTGERRETRVPTGRT